MKIFLDVDGILADFVSAALKVHGCEYPWFDRANLGEYDMVKLLGMSATQFWKPMDHEFWATLKLLPDGFQLLELLEGNHHDLYLSTSPCMAPGCSSGKHKWIQELLPQLWPKSFIGSAKHVFAQIPGAVLIDDSDHNVDTFREAGGRAILYPQPWNSAYMYAEEALAYVSRKLYGDRLY